MADLKSFDQRNLFGADVLYSNFLDPEDLCYVLKREIAPLIKDSDFEGMYKDGGRPPISPRILILTLLMQFLERLPDRAACLNLKYRLDWKIAFDLPVDFRGFHPTTLVYFRERLIANDQAALMFDRIIEHLKGCGLIKKGGKQRIDSTHIIGCVRELSRIELLHETLRLFCVDVLELAPSMDAALTEVHQHYLEKISTYGITDIQKKEMIQKAGLSMKGFLIWAEITPFFDKIQIMKSFQTMQVVFKQNFIDSGNEQPPELIKISTGKGHVSSPHETEACYANKGKKGWIGYKGQVVETINTEDDGAPGFITHIEAQDSTAFDGDCVQNVIEELQKKDIVPAEIYGDTHYNTSENIAGLENQGVALQGPVQLATKEKKEKDLGFQVDLENRRVVCPMGVESKHFHESQDGKTVGASFPKEDCQSCQRRNICQPQLRGKIYEQRLENKVLAARREKMKDPAYREDLHHRNGIEGTLSGLVRGQAWRRCRYRGEKKSKLQAKLTGAAANLSRLHRYRVFQARKAQSITA